MHIKSHSINPYIQLLVLVCALFFSVSSNAQLSIQLESGAVFTGLNDIRTGSDGDLFSLKTDLESPASPFLRARISYRIDEKHFISILYAPLKLTVTGAIDRDITFDGKIYEANQPLEAVYQFNSYRLTYNYALLRLEKFKLGLGLSAKIRDAGITLENENTFGGDFSIGFVPLINVISEWTISPKFGVLFFGDGLIASRGRALDLALTAKYKFREHWESTIGYRMLDGGSDGASQYNFVRFHYATIGVVYQF